LAPDAEEACSAELVEWADIIFVMEKAHRAKLQKRFRASLKRARVVCLDIPDDYAFMQPELVALLEKKVGALPLIQSCCLVIPAEAKRRALLLSSRPKRSGEPGRDGL